MKDLFGHPLDCLALPMPSHEQRRIKRRKWDRVRGYAAPPGTGPKGQTCGTCRFAYCNAFYKKHFWKCKLLFATWAASTKTDIRLKSPACSKWLPAVQKDSAHISKALLP